LPFLGLFLANPSDIQSLLAFPKVTPLADKEVFENAITRPITSLQAVGLSRLRAATSCFALRRTKEVLEKAIDLPLKTVTVEAVPCSEGSIHKTVHDAICEVARMVLVELFDDGEQRTSPDRLRC
jgi:SNF2 family DNA or RNA helicase